MELVRKRYEVEHDYLENDWNPKKHLMYWSTSEGKEICTYENIYLERIPDFCNRLFEIAMKYNESLIVR